jgi:O-antigen/teichoic acid export membrane protein
MIAIGAEMGTSPALVKYVSEYTAKRNINAVQEVISTVIVIKATLGVAMGAFAFCLSDIIATQIFHNIELSPFIRVASIGLFIANAFGITEPVYQAFQRFRLMAAFSVLSTCLRLLFVALTLFLGFGAMGVAVAWVLVKVLGGLASMIALFKIFALRPRFPRNFTTYIKRILSFGVYPTITSIIAIMQAELSHVLLGIYRTPHDVGLFGVAAKIAIYSGFFPHLLSTSLYPIMSEFTTKGEYGKVQKALELSVKYALIFSLPIAAALMTFATPIVSILCPPEYIDAATVLPLLTSYGILLSIGVGMHTLCYSIGKPGICTKASACVAITNTVLCLTLIPKLGLRGAALALVTAWTVGAICLYLLTTRATRFTIPLGTSLKLIPALISMIIVFVMTYGSLGNVLGPIMRLVLSVVIGTFTYVMVLIMTAITSEDLDRVRRVLTALILR